jgi:hypothetical protein
MQGAQKLNPSKVNKPIKDWATELNRNFSEEEVQMAKKNHMKKCSPSLAIKEMQIKTTLRFHFSPVKTATIKNTNNKCWQVCRGKGTLIHCWWECKIVQSLWKTKQRLLRKLNIDLPYDPAISLLGIYPKECDSGYYKDT